MRILSWNAHGGDGEALAETLAAKAIDLCVLQEAKVKADDPWYEPLSELQGYAVLAPQAENVCRKLPGGTLAPAEGVIRAYTVVRREATVPAAAIGLLDFTEDPNLKEKLPADPFDAAQLGYNLRPPLTIQLNFGEQPVTVFSWHAPLGHTTKTGIDLFRGSKAYSDAVAGHAVIAGDLNVKSVAGIFIAFAGVQETNSKLDYILANTELGKVKEIGGVALKGDAHWAIAATVEW